MLDEQNATTTPAASEESGPRERGLVRRGLLVASEFVIALVLVLLSFTVMQLILGISFPQGATLRSLMEYEEMLDGQSDEAAFELQLPDGNLPLVASLSDLQRAVRDRPAGAIAWHDARRGMGLHKRHAIQTLSDSKATIAFDETHWLDLGQNSLLILRDVRQRESSKRISASVVAIEGEFHGRFAGTDDGASMDLQLSTDNGTFEVTTTKREAADFKMSVKTGGESTLNVYEGQGKVTVAGDEVVVPANHSMTVTADGRLGRLVELPAAPRPASPQEAQPFVFNSMPPRVGFEWDETSGADGYRLVLAHDPEFKQIVLDRVQTARELTHENLAAGSYHWRVSARRGASEGRPSKARSFQLLEDAHPPGLEVDFPESGPTSDRLVLRGRAEPGSRVYIRNLEVKVGETGDFQHDLRLRPGANLIVVEAVDAAGNVAYLSSVLSTRL